MATRAEWSCPICREAMVNIAYVGPCMHQFCWGCIMHWATKNPSCPLCRQPVDIITYPAQHFLEMPVQQPSVPQRTSPQEEPSAAGPQPQAHVAGLPPERWALFFCNHMEILQPVELWLNEVLGRGCWWDVVFLHGKIVASLCRYGLHEEALVQELQPFLQEQTATFIRQLIAVAADQCIELLQRRGERVTQLASLGAVTLPDRSSSQEEHNEGPEQAGGSGAGRWAEQRLRSRGLLVGRQARRRRLTGHRSNQ